jgi:hypothetical protein
MNSELLTFHHGSSFSNLARIFCVVASLFGFGIMIEDSFFGIFLSVLGIGLFSSSYGTQLDTKNQQIREYGSLFWLKYGKWIPLSGFSHVVIISVNESYLAYSRSSYSTSVTYEKLGVCVMDSNFRRRIIVAYSTTKNEANSIAEKISTATHFPISLFNPKISEKTKSRRSKNEAS